VAAQQEPARFGGLGWAWGATSRAPHASGLVVDVMRDSGAITPGEALTVLVQAPLGGQEEFLSSPTLRWAASPRCRHTERRRPRLQRIFGATACLVSRFQVKAPSLFGGLTAASA
jgi:hypothetical protein